MTDGKQIARDSFPAFRDGDEAWSERHIPPRSSGMIRT